MVVICKKGSSKLLKGNRYEVSSIWSNNHNLKWFVSIKGFGSYSINSFTDADGKKLPEVVYSSNTPIMERTKFEDIKIGDIVVCLSDRYKSFVKGCKYRICDLITEEKIYNYNNTSRKYYTYYIKLEGISRKIHFNPYQFRKLNTEESREMTLSSVLDDKPIDILTTSKFRKIEMVENKNDILLKSLSKTILDNNRHGLGVVDWTCRKLGNRYDIEKSDYDHLMGLTLKEVLDIIN